MDSFSFNSHQPTHYFDQYLQIVALLSGSFLYYSGIVNHSLHKKSQLGLLNPWLLCLGYKNPSHYLSIVLGLTSAHLSL